MDIPVQVFRSSKLQRPVTVELQFPEQLREMFDSDVVTLAPGVDSGRLYLRVNDDSRIPGQWDLVVRATSIDSQGQPVVSQSVLDVLVLPANKTVATK